VRLALLMAGAALAVAGSAWAGAASDPPADKPPVKDSVWLAAPSFEELQKAYPKAALDAHASGEAAMRCNVKPDGALAGCVLARETPTGMGFGQAALALADQFRMKPEAIPRPAPGEAEPAVTVPIRWAIVEQPKWVRMPTGDQLADLYPAGARNRLMPGEARIRCEVQADGTLANCSTLFEAPVGMGFADATLRAARYFRMEPVTLDGKPVAGGMVVIPLHWQVAGSGSQVQVGDGARLVAILKPGAKPGKEDREFNCATPADKARMCLAIGVPWRDQPSLSQVWDVTNRRHVEAGVTSLACRVGDDGALDDCEVSGKATPDKAAAAMRELAAGLKARPETSDGIPTRGQLVLVPFDWAQLRQAARPAPGAAR
jgi:TonB family protein